jgi:hypothetical protein
LRAADKTRSDKTKGRSRSALFHFRKNSVNQVPPRYLDARATILSESSSYLEDIMYLKRLERGICNVSHSSCGLVRGLDRQFPCL